MVGPGFFFLRGAGDLCVLGGVVFCFSSLFNLLPLAYAKNGDQQQPKIHAANGKTEACTQGALNFFSFKFWVGVREEFFHFSFLPNMFPLCSLQVPNGFPSSSQCVPQGYSPLDLALIPYVWPIFQWNLLFGAASIVSTFLTMGQSK
jgi:hypothetical protein